MINYPKINPTLTAFLSKGVYALMMQIILSDFDFLLKIILFFAIILLNGYFVAAEIAIVSIRPSRVDELVKSGKTFASPLKYLIENQSITLSSVQVGVTSASLAMGVLIGDFLDSFMNDLIGSVVPSLSEINLSGLQFQPGSVISFLIGTFFLVVLGELVFKGIALQHTEGVALFVAWPLSKFSFAMKPVIFLLDFSASAILLLLGIKFERREESFTESELKRIVSRSRVTGELLDKESEIIRKTFSLNDKIALEVMTPYQNLTIVSARDNYVGNLHKILKSGHSRILVYDDNPEEILGFLHVKDLLENYISVLEDGKSVKTPNILSFLHEVDMIAETITLDRLLVRFQQRKRHIALVVDEFGMTQGLVSLEDVLEEIVGEIEDEFDKEETVLIQQLEQDNKYVLDGSLSVKDFNEHFGTEINPDYSVTISGYLTEFKGDFPTEKETVEIKMEDRLFSFFVSKKEHYMIKQIELTISS